MITFKEIAERIDKSRTRIPFDVNDLLKELQINSKGDYFTDFMYNRGDDKLKCYYFKALYYGHYYTYYNMFFLCGEPMGFVVNEPKDNDYHWFSYEHYFKMKEYMESLFEDNGKPIIQICKLDVYFDEPYKIYDSEFIIRKENNMYYNGEKVIDFHTKVFDNSKLARITTESNKMFYEVPMSDLDFKLHILDEN